MTNKHIPYIPSTAPFTPEQRAWLNGYFVGLLSSADVGLNSSQLGDTGLSPEPLLIGYGSQTGSAERLAKNLAKEAAKHNHAATIKDLNSITMAELQTCRKFLLVTSTWGDGEPPDNALTFWTSLSSQSAPSLQHLSFAVLALGDRNYSNFCGAGKSMDTRLAELGARRLVPRTDCDVDYEASAVAWANAVWSALGKVDPSPVSSIEIEPAPSSRPKSSEKAESWSRKQPFPAVLIENRLLNQNGSAKETRHFTISLSGSKIQYHPGDALGIYPSNCPELVEEILQALNVERDAPVELAPGVTCTMHEALQMQKEIRRPSLDFLKLLAERHKSSILPDLLRPERKGELEKFLTEREVIDFLQDLPPGTISAAELVSLLPKLQPRLYSISSSLMEHPDQVHLTVATVRYSSLGRTRKGVCSTFLADRASGDIKIPLFIQSSHFRLPTEGSTPVIMIGPGTGVAPFRAFLQERRATGATGKNWLFFGDQKRSCDFLYQEEIQRFISEGYLHRFDAAFSRDQKEKVYVQNRMLEEGRELWAWLQAGAHFYVCGDAKRMARDVDAALHQIIQTHGQQSPEQAAEYVQALKQQKRYQRDVY